MSYIDLLNMFYDLLQETRVSNNAQLLYYTLLAINNRCSWADWFARTNINLSGIMGVSTKAVINARNELKQLGLIDYMTSKKRGECTKYRILYSTNFPTKELQRNYNGTTTELQTSHIIRQRERQREKEDKEDRPLARVAEFYESNIGAIPRYVVEEMQEAVGKGFQEELILEALRIAVSNNVRKWSYVKKILEDCEAKGLYTLSAFNTDKEARKRNGAEKRNFKQAQNVSGVSEKTTGKSLGNVY